MAVNAAEKHLEMIIKDKGLGPSNKALTTGDVIHHNWASLGILQNG
jgi:hypothetical protein